MTTRASARLCENIHTVAMVYLDGELAAEESHELETHLTECATCRIEVDTAQMEQDVLRLALATPRASDTMRARIAAALDQADRAEAVDLRRAERRRWSSWLLPGSAIAAAAAALIVFVAGSLPSRSGVGAIARAGVHQQIRAIPLENGGPTFGGTTVANELSQVEGSRLLGHRILPEGVSGHDATLYAYDVPINDGAHRIARRVVLTVLVIENITRDQMSDGEPVRAGDRLLRVVNIDGHTAVTAVDSSQRGYMFMAAELSSQELVALVGRTSLVGPQ